jgi:hypothetical protein
VSRALGVVNEAYGKLGAIDPILLIDADLEPYRKIRVKLFQSSEFPQFVGLEQIHHLGNHIVLICFEYVNKYHNHIGEEADSHE